MRSFETMEEFIKFLCTEAPWIPESRRQSAKDEYEKAEEKKKEPLKE